jgi:tetratricopeptide (TPR) repeat protein
MYDDSTQLARTYSALHAWRAFYADEYAHACYHYGKLLRAKEDPVSAMQVFINATHSRTRDYHILGRVYSNMGDICHLAGDYSMAYDMYRQSGEWYLRNGDTLLYYYDLNNMAFELAEQGKKEEAFRTLIPLNIQFDDKYLQCKIVETKANAYLNAFQYDSAIFCAHKLFPSGENEATILMICSQAYSYMENKDSAAYYAKRVLKSSPSLSDLNNALYILTNDDVSKDLVEVRHIAADRADVQKLLEIRQGKLSQAVQLLEQDLSRKPDWKWLYAVCLTLCIIGVVLGVYIRRKHQKRTLLSQQIYELEIRTNEAIAHKRLQIISNCALYSDSNDIRKNLCWNDYDKMCHIVDQQFYMLASKLRHQNMLNEKELRLCILVLLNLSRQEISEILPYALSGIGKLKDHTAKKLGSTGKNLHDFLLKMAIEG